jgi:hypothetical protein
MRWAVGYLSSSAEHPGRGDIVGHSGKLGEDTREQVVQAVDRKDCHVRIVVAGLRRTFHGPPGMRFFSKRQRTARSSHRVCLSRLGGQRLAILVHQGRHCRIPGAPGLLTRESARLFLGF